MSYKDAIKKDKKTLGIIENCDLEKINEIDACGKIGIQTLMYLSKKNNYKIKLLNYYNSGDIIGDHESVVGYGAFAIYK